MLFFWPLRKQAEPSDTKEDPYDDKNEQEPKRRRKESSSSEGSSSETKLFGELPDSDASSSSDSEEEEPRIQEIPNDAPDDEIDEYEASEKLEMITTYLRTAYYYCHWCGVHYQDGDDMETNCPGSTKDDH